MAMPFFCSFFVGSDVASIIFTVTGDGGRDALFLLVAVVLNGGSDLLFLLLFVTVNIFHF